MRLSTRLRLARRGYRGLVTSEGGATSHFSGRELPLKDRIISIVTTHWDASLGVSVALTANFFYLMDFWGYWAEQAVKEKLRSKNLEESLQSLKQSRAEMEAKVARKRAEMAKNGSGI